jgi:hypothetical protein
MAPITNAAVEARRCPQARSMSLVNSSPAHRRCRHNRQRQLAAARPQLVLAINQSDLAKLTLVVRIRARAGPALAGLIVAKAGSPVAVLSFAASVSVAALTATFAPGIRTMRPPEEGPPT